MVIPPSELKNYDVEIIICTRLYQEIFRQLQDLGIDRDNIFIGRPQTNKVARWDPLIGILENYGSDLYDNFYATPSNYWNHYKESVYYKGWKEVLQYLSNRENSILEIGCGSGQFANMLFDNGYLNYTGMDFSNEAIRIAKKVNPKYQNKFFVANALTTDLVIEKYDIIICFEVLEHIQEDIELLDRIQPGTRLLLSVPNYDSAYHVRYFETSEKVYNRYKDIVDIFEMKTVYFNETDCLYYFWGKKL